MNLPGCRLIDLRRIDDSRGCLTSIESNKDIPFEIKRIYYLYNVPNDAKRGAHAHRNLHQLFIAISGSFDITLSDGNTEQRYHLDAPYQGLYVSPMKWRDIDTFSDRAVCMVLASDYYDECDYIRTHADFLTELAGVSKT